MIRFCFLLIIAIVFAPGCNKLGISTRKNENIAPELRDTIARLDEKLLQIIRSDDTAGLKEFYAAGLLEKTKDSVAAFTNHLFNKIADDNHIPFNVYAITNFNESGIVSIPLQGEGVNRYTLTLSTHTATTCISQFFVNSKNRQEFLITVIYGKYEGQWKINSLLFRQYRIAKQTAPELYTRAKEFYSRNELLDAYNYVRMMQYIINPADKFWHYDNEKELVDFGKEVIAKSKQQFVFPDTIRAVDSLPVITRIDAITQHAEITSFVHYKTKTDIRFPTVLEEERQRIKAVLPEKYKGIFSNSKYIVFRAYNGLPAEFGQAYYYTFIDTLR